MKSGAEERRAARREALSPLAPPTVQPAASAAVIAAAAPPAGERAADPITPPPARPSVVRPPIVDATPKLLPIDQFEASIADEQRRRRECQRQSDAVSVDACKRWLTTQISMLNRPSTWLDCHGERIMSVDIDVDNRVRQACVSAPGRTIEFLNTAAHAMGYPLRFSRVGVFGDSIRCSRTDVKK